WSAGPTRGPQCGRPGGGPAATATAESTRQMPATERSEAAMPKTIEDEAWWTLWAEDEGDIRHGLTAARRPAPATGVGVLDRAIDVLDAVENGARSFTAIADATGLTKPTAHRMITALQAHGF